MRRAETSSQFHKKQPSSRQEPPAGQNNHGVGESIAAPSWLRCRTFGSEYEAFMYGVVGRGKNEAMARGQCEDLVSSGR